VITRIVRYAALGASMIISFAVERDLALSHGVPVSVASAVPVGIDLFLVWAVRSRRDVALAVSVAVAANVAGVLTAESLSAVNTWVAAGLHAVFPLTVWRMERPADSGADTVTGDPVCAPQMAAESLSAVADNWPSDDLWRDFEDSAPDALPPTPDAIRAAIDRLSAGGRKVTGPMLGDHFGVSARTGRRYLAMAT
jgi:hypothetical protein